MKMSLSEHMYFTLGYVVYPLCIVLSVVSYLLGSAILAMIVISLFLTHAVLGLFIMVKKVHQLIDDIIVAYKEIL